MSDEFNKQLPKAPPITPSPAISEVMAKPRKPRPIPRMVVAATDALLSGDAKNLTQAAAIAGCSRVYLSRVLSQRPDAVQYMQQRAARTVGIASTAAAARMASLIHAESEHVSFRASEHVLGVSGIQPARDAAVNVSVSVKSGYLIDLREERDRTPLPTELEGAAGAVVVDTPKVIDANPVDAKVD